MATATMKCRVCGKEYKSCHTLKRIEGVFRWQEVACSPECGSVYLAEIEASRAVNPVGNNNAIDNTKVVKDVMSDDYGIVDYDDLVDDEEFVFNDDLDD